MSEASAPPEAEAQAAKQPALGISFNTQLGPDKNLALQAWIPMDTTVQQLNAVLDKFWSAADRLESRSKIFVLEKSIETLQRDNDQNMKNLAKMDFALQSRQAVRKERGRQGEDKPPAGELEARRAIENAVEVNKDKIVKFTKDLAELKRVAYGDADGSTDLHARAPDR